MGVCKLQTLANEKKDEKRQIPATYFLCDHDHNQLLVCSGDEVSDKRKKKTPGDCCMPPAKCIYDTSNAEAWEKWKASQ